MTRRPDATDADAIHDLVREGYTRVVEEHGAADAARAHATARRIGYAEEDLAAVPADANLGVGCGNPTAIDTLRPGETVVDLGSGAGMDALLAARQVGPTGRVIGIDMTDAMLEKARANAAAAAAANVEFRKGTIEALPLPDASVDAIISNCVINLSPRKDRVYAEAFRVLRPGGRIMISDIVLERPLPDEVVASLDAYVGCIGGASLRAAYLATVERAGFREVRITREASFAAAFDPDDPGLRDLIARLGITPETAREYAGAVTSLHLYARK